MELMLMYFPIAYVKSVGQSNEIAVWIRGGFIISNTVGGFLIGLACDKQLTEPSRLTTVCNFLAAIPILTLPYLPNTASQAVFTCIPGLLLGSRTTTNTLILIQFYGKTALGPALAMTNNFRVIGSIVAPMIYTHFLDRHATSKYTWYAGGLSCLLSSLFNLLAEHLTNKNTSNYMEH